MKRARLEQEKGGRSVFHFPCQKLTRIYLSRDDRSTAAALCAERKLDTLYYEGTLSLYWRAKKCLDQDHLGLHGILAAMFVTLKYCGSKGVMYHGIDWAKAKGSWPTITAQSLQELELRICEVTNWDFF